MKVIASQIRKGNVVEVDGQLYVVLTAENFHPGKGTPTTQIDMRRISDGTKVSQRYKTTEQVERAFIEDQDFQYLFEDGDGFTFMNGETFDQVVVPKDIVGDQSVYLQENMTVRLQPLRRRAGGDRAAAAGDAGGGRDRAGDEGPDGRLVLQAGDPVQRRQDHVPPAHRAGHPHRGD